MVNRHYESGYIYNGVRYMYNGARGSHAGHRMDWRRLQTLGSELSHSFGPPSLRATL
jgi:hypothetical protein